MNYLLQAEPFQECCGLGTVTSASKACYDDDMNLIGVAGTSVPMDLLTSNTYSFTDSHSLQMLLLNFC